MNRFLSACLATALLAGPLSPLVAKEIYTWKDENGVVHYVDTPPDNPNAQAVTAPEAYRPGSVSTLPDAAPADESPATEPEVETAGQDLSAADARRQELAARRAERRAEDQELAELCARARAQLADLEPSRRVFYEDEQGETVRMDDDQRMNAIEENRKLIEEYCR